MATNQTVYKTQPTTLPLEEAQNLPPRLATALFLRDALVELDAKAEELTEAEFKNALSLIITVVEALTEPAEA